MESIDKIFIIGFVAQAAILLWKFGGHAGHALEIDSFFQSADFAVDAGIR